VRKLIVVVVLGLLALLVAAPPADAKSPRQVDPLTMTPALNPDFAPWSCFETGGGITCQGEFDPTYENELLDFDCGGQPVYVSGGGHEHMTRWHDAQGRALKTIVGLDYPDDRFSLSPGGDGPYVSVRAHWNRHYVYPVPGDRSQRVFTEIGAIFMVNVPGQGLVLHDAGRVTWVPGEEFETIAIQHGIHDVYDDPDSFSRVICDALT
jgi:hypothetical protein